MSTGTSLNVVLREKHQKYIYIKVLIHHNNKHLSRKFDDQDAFSSNFNSTTAELNINRQTHPSGTLH